MTIVDLTGELGKEPSTKGSKVGRGGQAQEVLAFPTELIHPVEHQGELP
jgi:hypothetical protein